jgi:hypothetical protein
MTPLLNLKTAARLRNCSPSALLRRAADGELPVFATFGQVRGNFALEDIPDRELLEMARSFHEKEMGVHGPGPAKAYFQGKLPPSNPADCFRVPAGVLEELNAGQESVKTPCAVIEEHHSLKPPGEGRAWFVYFAAAQPITLENLRFRESDLEQEAGAVPGPPPCFPTKNPPRTPLATFLRMLIASGVRDAKQAWSQLNDLAKQKDQVHVFRVDSGKGILAEFECKLKQTRTPAKMSENVEAVRIETVDGTYRKTVDRYTFMDGFNKQHKRYS